MYEKIKRLTESLRLPKEIRIPSHGDLIKDLLSFKARYGDKLTFRTNGKSRKGLDLLYAEIGRGERVIAVTAAAHADELTGVATSFHLIQNLLSNPAFETILEKYKFVFHPMLDPDGSVLNHVWAKQSFSYKEFLKHKFRNSMAGEDCEHGIPVREDQQIRPELKFFKDNIDKHKGKIDFYITLHATPRLGGSLFILSAKGENRQRISALTQVCADSGLPVWDFDLFGERGMERIAPGFLTAPPMAKMAEKYKDNPEILKKIKMPTYEYVEQYCGAPFCLISELPLIVDPNLLDTSITDVDLADFKRQGIGESRTWATKLQKAVAELEALGVSGDIAWFRNAAWKAQSVMSALDGKEKLLDNFKGKKARRYHLDGTESGLLEMDLEIHQLYIKCLEGRADQKALYQRHCDEFDRLYEKLEKVIDSQVVPLETQVRLQVAMILSGIER
jgi:hypothetical protein